ncbi:hypothetical protein TIFTF001_037077 [Ficus carica]|uniref:Uncharacterized protein n=1 Tax=Ficus carica TaxID=3494 RepID=A0AA88JDC9_FICCA|nr:hypothetical protein TIFTF001_037077 [Ficus carica]
MKKKKKLAYALAFILLRKIKLPEEAHRKSYWLYSYLMPFDYQELSLNGPSLRNEKQAQGGQPGLQK